MEANPYSAPAANLYGTVQSGGDSVSPSTIAALAGTKPWVRFMSVLLCILSGVMLIFACIMIFAAATGVMNSTGNTAYNSGVLVGTALYHGLMTFLVIYPAVKLWKYANSIGRVMATRSVADLDSALTEQRRYWKFQGLLVIIGLCFAIIGVIAVVSLGMTAAMKSGFQFPR